MGASNNCDSDCGPYPTFAAACPATPNVVIGGIVTVAVPADNPSGTQAFRGKAIELRAIGDVPDLDASEFFA